MLFVLLISIFALCLTSLGAPVPADVLILAFPLHDPIAGVEARSADGAASVLQVGGSATPTDVSAALNAPGRSGRSSGTTPVASSAHLTPTSSSISVVAQETTAGGSGLGGRSSGPSVTVSAIDSVISSSLVGGTTVTSITGLVIASSTSYTTSNSGITAGKNDTSYSPSSLDINNSPPPPSHRNLDIAIGVGVAVIVVIALLVGMLVRHVREVRARSSLRAGLDLDGEASAGISGSLSSGTSGGQSAVTTAPTAIGEVDGMKEAGRKAISYGGHSVGGFSAVDLAPSMSSSSLYDTDSIARRGPSASGVDLRAGLSSSLPPGSASRSAAAWVYGSRMSASGHIGSPTHPPTHSTLYTQRNAELDSNRTVVDRSSIWTEEDDLSLYAGVGVSTSSPYGAHFPDLDGSEHCMTPATPDGAPVSAST